VWQAIVELEVHCILLQVGVLKLKSVILVEELEVPLSAFSDCGVVGVKGQLSGKPPTDAARVLRLQMQHVFSSLKKKP